MRADARDEGAREPSNPYLQMRAEARDEGAGPVDQEETPFLGGKGIRTGVSSPAQGEEMLPAICAVDF